MLKAWSKNYVIKNKFYLKRKVFYEFTLEEVMFKNLTFNENEKKYIQIARYIRELINRGVLIEGSKLPSSREISSILSIGRNTVMSAYEILESEGLVETIKGKGTFVKKEFSNEKSNKVSSITKENSEIKEDNKWNIDWKYKTNEYGVLAESLDIIKSEEKWEKGMISFKSIAPPGNLFNIEELKRSFSNRIALEKHKIVNYGYAVGYKPFIDYLKDYMKEKGAYSEEKEVIVTNGFTEGLDMMLSAFTKEGDYILCENPTHNTALKIMKTHKLNIIGVKMTKDGMDIEDLNKKIKKFGEKIKFAYLIPSYHNPTGVVASIKKREEVYNVLKDSGIPIIEDGFNEELLYESSPTIPLASLDRESNGVIYIGSFSKILFPGLRIGWVYGDKKIIGILESVKRCRNIHTSFLDQGILYDFMISGAFEKYIKKVRKVYKEKYKFTKRVIEKYIPKAEIWGEGGLYMFLKIKGVDTRELLKRCYDRGVLFMPGDLFYIDKDLYLEKENRVFSLEGHNIKGREKRDTLRIGFTRLSEEEIEKGIKIIGEEVKSILT